MERKERRSPSYSRYEADRSHSPERRHHHEHYKKHERSRSRLKSHERHKKHRKADRSRHRSRSPSSEDHFNQKLAKMREDTAKRKLDRKPTAGLRPAEGKTYKVNNTMLSLMLKDNIKANERMDKEELVKATEKLKQYDNTGRQAVLMTSHINTVRSEQAVREKRPELPFGCEYCSQRFGNSKDLAEHLASHPESKGKDLL